MGCGASSATAAAPRARDELSPPAGTPETFIQGSTPTSKCPKGAAIGGGGSFRTKRVSRADRAIARIERQKAASVASAQMARLAQSLRTETEADDNDVDDDDKALGSVDVIQKMMIGVTEQAKAVAGAERCTFWLVNPKTAAMWSFLTDAGGSDTSINLSDDGDGDKAAAAAERILRMPVGTGVAGQCAATAKVINIADAWKDDRFDKSFDEASNFRTTAVLCVPVLKAAPQKRRQKRADRQIKRFNSQDQAFQPPVEDLSQRVVGVLQIINNEENPGKPFDPKVQVVLAKLVDDASLVLHASELYQQLVGLHSESFKARKVTEARVVNAAVVSTKLEKEPET